MIGYEKDNGNQVVFAECPDCENVVQPKQTQFVLTVADIPRILVVLRPLYRWH
ncbi:DUF7837 family putative zinc-binding protein [Haladaptatus halobius]|uniref:DUF7837 family putative zinc-binding protein n=1 Tax=Haladaptatus halobius TaxID=2884875 RepID=UPI003F644397